MNGGLELDVIVVMKALTLRVHESVQSGQTVVILGPNGAGKSTLLRAVAGLQPIDAGTIRLNSSVLDDPSRRSFLQAAGRGTGFVFQDLRLFPHLSVLDNVAFARRVRDASARDARAASQPFLAAFNIEHLSDHRPHQLSGGESQRVALARAWASEPAMLLLDEPTAALDAHSRSQVRAALKAMLAQFPGPTLLVSHDPVDAFVLADRILIIEGGSVVQGGAPREVARRPQTPYVARLMGLNLLQGELHPGERAVRLTGGGEITVADSHLKGRVQLAIGPSAIAVHRVRPSRSSPRNTWRGVICAMEYLGDRVRLDVDGQPSVLVDVTAEAVAELALEVNEQIWLSVKATEIEVYEAIASPPSPPMRARTSASD